MDAVILFPRFSLLSTIPSHFICYLLKSVYAIISECSIKPIESSKCGSEPSGDGDQQAASDGIFSNVFSKSNAKAAQSQINEEKENDQRTVYALREFLSRGTGGRILRVLESLDLKVFDGHLNRILID